MNKHTQDVLEDIIDAIPLVIVTTFFIILFTL